MTAELDAFSRIGLAMKTCNLCGFPILRIQPGVFGSRCVRCLSTSIHRAVGKVLDGLRFSSDIDVYELSSRGALCRYHDRRFPNTTFSEYFDDVEPGDFRRGVQCQNVQRLTFASGSFDLVTSTEVFEHVADDTAGFQEIFRVLRTGGHFVFTVPLSGADTTVERAVIRGTAVVPLLPLNYHGDRIRGTGKVLVFRDYGLDLEEKLAAGGFSVRIVPVDDARHAIHNTRVIVCSKQPALSGSKTA